MLRVHGIKTADVEQVIMRRGHADKCAASISLAPEDAQSTRPLDHTDPWRNVTLRRPSSGNCRRVAGGSRLWCEDAIVHQPCSSVEFGVELLDSEAIRVRRVRNDLEDSQTNDGLESVSTAHNTLNPFGHDSQCHWLQSPDHSHSSASATSS